MTTTTALTTRTSSSTTSTRNTSSTITATLEPQYSTPRREPTARSSVKYYPKTETLTPSPPRHPIVDHRSSAMSDDKGEDIAPPFHGFIATTYDALLVFEAARRGMIPRVTRRLNDSERNLVKSGSVFVYDEQESGIKRWTDGHSWSPSRILANFLVRFVHGGRIVPR